MAGGWAVQLVSSQASGMCSLLLKVTIKTKSQPHRLNISSDETQKQKRGQSSQDEAGLPPGNPHRLTSRSKEGGLGLLARWSAV